MNEKNAFSPHDEIKGLIADAKLRIKLYDYIKEESDKLITNTSEEFFPMNAPWNNNELVSRLKLYEDLSSDLISIMSLIGYWGTLDHLPAVSILPKQFALQLGKEARSNNWTALRWYPLMLLTYAIGIGALAINNYPILHSFFQSTCKMLSHSIRRVPLVLMLEEGFGAARDLFRALPGHEKQYYPASEYLFGFFNGKLNDIFLGDEYEDIFDRCELFYALQHAHEGEKISSGHVWGPIGRFGWKYSSGVDSNPFRLLSDEASHIKETWTPLGAGFFDGSYERFEKLTKQYEQILQTIH